MVEKIVNFTTSSDVRRRNRKELTRLEDEWQNRLSDLTFRENIYLLVGDRSVCNGLPTASLCTFCIVRDSYCVCITCYFTDGSFLFVPGE